MVRKQRLFQPETMASLRRRYRRVMPRYFWANETRLVDIVVSGASGSRVTAADGRSYIDLTGQWATNNLGNVHPQVLAVTETALRRYGFLTYFLHPHEPMIELAEELLAAAPSKQLTRVQLELSGTGAVEAALKYAVERSGRPVVLSFMGQYHGLSIGTTNVGSLSAEERRYWEAFQGGVFHLPYPFPYRRPRGLSSDEFGDWVLELLEDRLLRYVVPADRIAGVIFEPVACEAGVWIPPKRFVQRLARLCRQHGWAFIADEVETGLGRTGRMWAIEHFGVEPDLVPIGKGISGGLMPIAATMGTEWLMGEGHVAAGTTFAGHPAACAAATETLRVIQRDGLVDRSRRLGRQALKRLSELERFDHVGEVRGLGLCLGIEIVRDKESKAPDPRRTRRIFQECIRAGTIPLYNYGDHVIRVEPPLTIPTDDLNAGMAAIERAIRSLAA